MSTLMIGSERAVLPESTHPVVPGQVPYTPENVTIAVREITALAHEGFWTHATMFHRLLDDLLWLRDRIDDPKLASHPGRDAAISEAQRLSWDVFHHLRDVSRAETNVRRRWEWLSRNNRAAHGLDAVVDASVDQDDLRGHFWQCWIAPELPATWDLNHWLVHHWHNANYSTYLDPWHAAGIVTRDGTRPVDPYAVPRKRAARRDAIIEKRRNRP